MIQTWAVGRGKPPGSPSKMEQQYDLLKAICFLCKKTKLSTEKLFPKEQEHREVFLCFQEPLLPGNACYWSPSWTLFSLIFYDVSKYKESLPSASVNNKIMPDSAENTNERPTRLWLILQISVPHLKEKMVPEVPTRLLPVMWDCSLTHRPRLKVKGAGKAVPWAAEGQVWPKAVPWTGRTRQRGSRIKS